MDARVDAIERVRRIRLRRGIDLVLGGDPRQQLGESKAVRRVALLAADHPELRLRALVEPGARVRLGDPLARDARRARIGLVSPAAGIVRAVRIEGRRALHSIEIELEGDGERRFDATPSERIGELPRGALVELLLESGAWIALRERPFERTPDPDSAPRALFVTALESDPLAPDAEVVVAARARDFADGIAALARLTDGPVVVCRGARSAIEARGERVVLADFDGPHPAGLAGTHMNALGSVGRGRSAWHVGYQEAIAIGALVRTGRIDAQRVIALGGPRLLRPRLVRVPLGASLDDLLEGELAAGPCRVVSGSPLSGRLAALSGLPLGRFHRAVCALDSRADARARGGPFVPTPAFERVFPLDLPIAPLLRALVVGDDERAEELGALELAEEDLALANAVCPSGIDYGALLRATLERIARAG